MASSRGYARKLMGPDAGPGSTIRSRPSVPLQEAQFGHVLLLVKDDVPDLVLQGLEYVRKFVFV